MYDTVFEVLNDAVITIQRLHFCEILGKDDISNVFED